MVADRNLRDPFGRARVIITADDGGASNFIDEAIADLARLGIITCAAAFANFDCLASLAHHLSGRCALTLHFNISSGAPLSEPNDVPALVNSQGQFNEPRSLIVDSNESLQSVITRFGDTVLTKAPSDEIQHELHKQLALFRNVTGIQSQNTSLHHDLDKFANVRACFYPPNQLPPSRQALLELGLLSGYGYSFCSPSQSISEYTDVVENLLLDALATSQRFRGVPFEIALHPSVDAAALGFFTAYLDERVIEYRAWKSQKISKLLEKGARSGTVFEFDSRFIEGKV